MDPEETDARQIALAHAVRLACAENSGRRAKEIIADAEAFHAFLIDQPPQTAA